MSEIPTPEHPGFFTFSLGRIKIKIPKKTVLPPPAIEPKKPIKVTKGKHKIEMPR